jgi:hypothetical protein
MSGGHFDYDQYRIQNIADSVDQLIRQNGKVIEYPSGYVISSFDETHHYKYPPEVIEKFKEGLEILRKAEIYAQRIDCLVSGDDGEESFISRLKEDLDKLNNK